jgi:polo-like kinase 1
VGSRKVQPTSPGLSHRPTTKEEEKQGAKSGVSQPAPPAIGEIWVKKWVDYSSKYGLGYILTSGATGVYYNDSTKVVLDPGGDGFSYLERHGSDRNEASTRYTLTDYPKEL